MTLKTVFQQRARLPYPHWGQACPTVKPGAGPHTFINVQLKPLTWQRKIAGGGAIPPRWPTGQPAGKTISGFFWEKNSFPICSRTSSPVK
jgi:hypothetical protein